MKIRAIGQQLRASRIARGQTQTQVASAVGLSRSTISLLESGKIPDLGVRKVLAIAAHLELSLVLVEDPRVDGEAQ